MYSLIHKALTPRKQIVKVKIVNILAPNVFIATLDSRSVAPTKLYLQLEHLITRVWQHEPGWHITESPAPGMPVIAMLKTKSNFKRGVVLSVCSINGILHYYVFLYDWGIIERFKITDLAKLPGDQQTQLKPRTFIIVHAGLVDVSSKHERSQNESQENPSTFDEGQGHGVSSSRRRHDACIAARGWFETGYIYMDTFKTFDSVILMADIKRRRKFKTDEPHSSHSQNEYLSEFMERKGYCRTDSKVRSADKDLQNNNWDSVAKRMEKMKYEKVVKRNKIRTGAGTDKDDPAYEWKDMYLFDVTS